MNTRKLLATNVAILLALGLTAQGAEAVKYFARAGSKMRIEGTSNIHDWQVESSMVGGSLEAGENFPTEPGQAIKPGKMEAQAEPFIVARSLKSIEKDGKPYSDPMDNIMHGKLKAQENPKILFKLKNLVLKTAPSGADAPYACEATGDIVVAGETKTVTMPVDIQPLAEKKLKITGTVTVKMSDFKIEPPAPAMAGGLIKTGDDVKLIFTWMLGQKTAAAK
jgi:hypothetical protein